MEAECPGIDQWREFQRFKDHWHSQPGARGRKTRWDATYRNWIRKAAEYAPRSQQRPSEATGTARARQAIQAGIDLERMLNGDQADRAITG